jgi:DNA topoisomerase VI subunit B
MEKDKIRREFRAAVNMTAAELQHWLETDESRRVGFKRAGDTESVGHASGRHILRVLGKDATDLTDEDYAHMRKVVGYVHRHKAQRPENIYTSRWRYSLMNWGHDPTKED